MVILKIKFSQGELFNKLDQPNFLDGVTASSAEYRVEIPTNSRLRRDF